VTNKTFVAMTVAHNTPQPPPIAEIAAENLSAENPPEKLRRAELAAKCC